MDSDIRKLTPEEIVHKEHVEYHRQCVQKFCNTIAERIVLGGLHHDETKLEEPECSIFVEHAFDKKRSYGSEEYYKRLDTDLKEALDHHYDHNRHHPEHFENGISGMDLVDVVEMTSDWIAASGYHKSKFEEIVQHNAVRFNIPDQLVSVILNTYDEVKHIKCHGKDEED